MNVYMHMYVCVYLYLLLIIHTSFIIIIINIKAYIRHLLCFVFPLSLFGLTSSLSSSSPPSPLHVRFVNYLFMLNIRLAPTVQAHKHTCTPACSHIFMHSKKKLS